MRLWALLGSVLCFLASGALLRGRRAFQIWNPPPPIGFTRETKKGAHKLQVVVPSFGVAGKGIHPLFKPQAQGVAI